VFHPPARAVVVGAVAAIQVDKEMTVVVEAVAVVLQQVAEAEEEALTVVPREETAEVLYSEAVPEEEEATMPAEHTHQQEEKVERLDKKE